ncbi:MAG: tetratricopeptide repeat protein [Deltaproteobacteria bacterium]|nr:tetratricopeptide repeat protein [Deltaproteobacteria bacterium]
MSVDKLHPDDLVDRELAGDLTQAESEALAAHRAGCASCAIESALRSDFAAERAASPVDDAKLQQAIDGAVVRLFTPRERIRRWWPSALLIAAALVIAAGAIASTVRAVRKSRADHSAFPASVQPVQSTPPADSPAVPTASAAEPQPSASQDPAETASPTPQTSRPLPPGSQPGPEALFAQANAARRAGKQQEAIRLYRALQQKYPESREAGLSHATLGQLLLDSRDPSAAMSEFDHYLQKHPGGEVTEEVLVSRAQSLERLGKRTEERAAWQQLLSRFPGSAHAPHAKQRLRELQ